MHSSRIVNLIIFLALLALFIPLAIAYPIREDEGYYLMAARLVMQGKLPYLDFFYTQTPLLPYIYGIWMKIFGMTWFSARAFAGVLCASLGLLIFEYTRIHLGKVFALSAVALFIFSNLTLDYQLVAKTYTLSSLFLLIACYLLTCKTVSWGKAVFFAGLFLGLAINVRLFFAGIVPIFFWGIWRGEEKSKSLWAFSIGLCLALLPNLIFILTDFGSYWFGNLGYHSVRVGTSDPKWLFFKWNVLENILGIRNSLRYNNPQFAMLLYSTLLYGVITLIKRKPANMVLSVGLMLSLINFVPTPTFTQYFTTVVPFFSVCTVLLFKELNQGQFKKIAIISFFIFTCIYIYLSPLNFQYYSNAKRVVAAYGERGNPQEGYPLFVSAFSRRLDALVPAGEVVVSVWPGYLLESKAAMLPGLENQFGIQIAEGVEQEKRRELKIVSESELFEFIRMRNAKWVILGPRDEVLRQGEKTYRQALEENGYKVVLKIGSVRIFSVNNA